MNNRARKGAWSVCEPTRKMCSDGVAFLLLLPPAAVAVPLLRCWCAVGARLVRVYDGVAVAIGCEQVCLAIVFERVYSERM